jgi:hypothetical protein
VLPIRPGLAVDPARIPFMWLTNKADIHLLRPPEARELTSASKMRQTVSRDAIRCPCSGHIVVDQRHRHH